MRVGNAFAVINIGATWLNAAAIPGSLAYATFSKIYVAERSCNGVNNSPLISVPRTTRGHTMDWGS
jgi:hypothetical protein